MEAFKEKINETKHEEKCCTIILDKEKNQIIFGDAIINNECFCNYEEIKNYEPPITSSENSLETLYFHDYLNIFILMVMNKKEEKIFLTNLLESAQKESIKSLWEIEYTNKLSYSIHLLSTRFQRTTEEYSNKSVKIEKKEDKENTENEIDNLECNQSNSLNENKNKKKRKIKKNKKFDSFQFNNNNDIVHDDNRIKSFEKLSNKSMNLNNHNSKIYEEETFLFKELHNMIEDIENEIDRVEKLYFIEMKNSRLSLYFEIEKQSSSNCLLCMSKSEYPDKQLENLHSIHESMMKNYEYHKAEISKSKSEHSNIQEQSDYGKHFTGFTNEFCNSLIFSANNPINLVNQPINLLDSSFNSIKSPFTSLNQTHQEFSHINSLGHTSIINQRSSNYNPKEVYPYYANNYMMNMNMTNYRKANQEDSFREQKKLIVIENVGDEEEE